MARLQTADLAGLAARGIAVPAFARDGLTPGVVHLGLGAFHRAHQAMVFDALLQQGDARWGVWGVAMRSTQLADDLAAQQGLYAVQIASHEGTRWQVPGALLRTSVLAREPQQVVEAIAAPGTRWLTLTVTEKAYTPALAGVIVQGLALRQARGLPGLTIASCDNLSDNGRRLQALCLEAARNTDPALTRWIAASCAFPNSMVDRIVPATTPARLEAAREALGVEDRGALGTEGFWEWVIEHRFVDDSDAALLAGAGVTVVQDVLPYEEAKLRMLNGSHSAMACIGAVAGLPVISDCISQPAIRAFIHALMTDEVAPHLSRPDWADYRDALLARFANPALQHSVHQIATDSSQKIPQRWPPSAVRQLHQDQPFEHLAFAAAAWMRYLLGVDERGQAYTVNDPMAATLQPLARLHAADASACVQALSAFPAVWGEVLCSHALWQSHVAHWLVQIRSLGVLAALADLNARHAVTHTPVTP